MLNYYGVDWVMFVLFSIHLYLIANKRRSSFIFGMLGSVAALVLAVMISSWGSTFMNSVFFFMHLRAYLKWTNL
jgi:hypothetical protein